MNDAEAARNLQTIRTLMERAALYRRALGPVMLAAGLMGCGGALAGWLAPLTSGAGFIGLWLGLAAVTISVAFGLVRRQALHAAEPFWTPPTRRIASAMLPPLFSGLVATLPLWRIHADGSALALALPPVWMIGYGLALHAAGFFTLRGVRWLGWAFVFAGALLAAAATLVPGYEPSLRQAHLMMGATFGAGHLVAGGWLTIRERKPAA